MNRRAVLLLGLVAGASSCWQTRPVQVTVQTELVYSCPQRAIVKVAGASLRTKPAVALAAAAPAPDGGTPAADAGATPISMAPPMIDQDEVSLLDDGTLQFVLPRGLSAGNYQVLLTFTNEDKPSTLRPGMFEYSLDTPNLTALTSVAVVDGPLKPVDAMVWRPAPGRGLDLAVLTAGGSMLSTYSNQQVKPDLAPLYDSSFVQRATVESSNLVQALLDSQQQTVGLVASAAVQANGPTAALSISSTGHTPPTLQLGAVVMSQYAAPRGQLVVSGNFAKGALTTQLLQLVVPTTGNEIAIIAYKNLELASPQTPSGLLATALLPVNILQPVTVLSADLNDDALTDVLLIAERPVAGNARSAVVVAITGDLAKPPVEILSGSNLGSVAALGDLDGDQHPDLVFGQTASEVKIYYNRLPKGAVIAYTGTDSQTVATVAAAKKLAVADYDGDRINDIIYAASDGVHVVVNHGLSPDTGVRTFDDSLVFPAPTVWDPAALIPTEFSGDHRVDFVVVDGASGKVWFLENSCTFL